MLPVAKDTYTFMVAVSYHIVFKNFEISKPCSCDLLLYVCVIGLIMAVFQPKHVADFP